MASKYAKHIKARNLIRHLGTEKVYQDRVNEVKYALKDGRVPKGVPNILSLIPLRSPSEIAEAYCIARVNKEDIQETLKRADLLLTAISQLLAEAYETHKLSQLDLTTEGKISVYPEPYLKVLDEEEFRQWGLVNGLEKSFKMPWQKANAIGKERLVAGEPEPDGTEARFRDRITWKRS